MRLRTILLIPMLALAACGGDDGGGSGGGGNGLASKPANEVVAAAAAALSDVGSYHIKGSQTNEDGVTTIDADYSTAASEFHFDNEGAKLDLIVIGEQNYLRANEAFWSKQGGSSGDQLAKLLADKWVIVGADQAKDFKKLVDELAPRNAAYCLQRDHGTIKNTGKHTLDGEDVVVLTDAGDQPGTSPGELSVAAEGPARPLRIRQTGPRKPGGKKPDPRCDEDGESTTTASDFRLSKYDEAVSVKAPEGAKPLEELVGAGGSTS